MALKFVGGKASPTQEGVNIKLLQNSNEANELQRNLRDAWSLIEKAGSSLEKLKRLAQTNQPYLVRVRQAEMNIDTALSNINTARSALGLDPS